MPYCTQKDVEFWGQFSSADFNDKGYDYNSSMQKAIQAADALIDEHCSVPKDFFQPGGVVIDKEFLNGVDVEYVGGITKFFNWYYGGTSKLRFKYSPVNAVLSLEEETGADTWTSRTEGTGSDFIVVKDGVRFVQNTPAYKYKNIRVTYRAGYKVTPGAIVNTSAMLAARILQQGLQSKHQDSFSIGDISVSPSSKEIELWTDDIKKNLESYVRDAGTYQHAFA